jgi:thiol:disulfide interchange protein
MVDNTLPPGDAEQAAEQAADAVGGVAMIGIFALVIVAYACVAAFVLGGLALIAFWVVTP